MLTLKAVSSPEGGNSIGETPGGLKGEWGLDHKVK